MFQSLFFWIHFYNPASQEKALYRLLSFNPCFSGFTSTTQRVLSPRWNPNKVSILVFLDSLLQHSVACAGERAIGGVSILVFLDSLLQPVPQRPPNLPRPSFNPCFSGFTSTTGVYQLETQRTSPVSILVFLDSLLQLSEGNMGLIAAVGFQSLFFWIHFYNSASAPPHPSRRGCVSILVFLDSLLQPLHRRNFRRRLHQFQSLFFWIHFYNKTGTYSTLSRIRVSILVFLDSLLQLLVCSGYLAPPVEFQSLVFLDSLLQRSMRS